MEGSDVNGYTCTAYSSISLAQTDYYALYYTGNCNSSGNGLVDGYVNTGYSWTLIGQAWLPGCASFGNNGGTLHESPDDQTWDSWATSLQHGPGSPLALSPNPVSGYNAFETWSN